MEQGYYKKVLKDIIHHDAIPEQFRYETIKDYPNGGKDVIKVVEIEGHPAWDEEIYESVYVEYTKKEYAELRIAELKKLLADSDYKAIKYAEGLINEQDYLPIKELRQSYRNEINELEEDLQNE